MISDINELRKALKGSNPRFRGVILWQGASLIDGAPVVAIASKILTASKNEKTGAMVQTYIIRSDIDPMDAVKSGDDVSVCGNCKHRPFLVKLAKARAKLLRLNAPVADPCYVQVAKSVKSVFAAFKRGRYAAPGIDYDVKLLPLLFEGLAFRIGTYGDPTAIPFQVWRAATLKALFDNGYTHQWQDPRFAAFKLLCMASVDSLEEMHEAQAMGWRTFRVRGAQEPLDREVERPCPASKEAGKKTSCDKCKGCGGIGAKAKISFAIISHGIGSPSWTVAA
jgi:hypothetical protein